MLTALKPKTNNVHIITMHIDTDEIWPGVEQTRRIESINWFNNNA